MTPEQARDLKWGDKLKIVGGYTNTYTFIGLDPSNHENLIAMGQDRSVGTFYCGEFEKVREPAFVYMNQHSDGSWGIGYTDRDIALGMAKSRSTIRTAIKFVEAIEDEAE